MVAGPATLGNELTKDAARPRSRAQKGVVIQLLEFLASLKLTVLLFALSIFLVYVIMASQFESVVYPLIILFSIPLAGVGSERVLDEASIPSAIMRMPASFDCGFGPP